MAYTPPVKDKFKKSPVDNSFRTTYNIVENENILHGIDLSIFKQSTSSLKCSARDMVNISNATIHQVYNENKTQVQLNSFLKRMWNKYTSEGCSWWKQSVNVFTNRLGTLNPNTTNYKTLNAEINFAKTMQNTCGCSEIIKPGLEEYSYTDTGALLKNETIDFLEKQKEKKDVSLNRIIKSFEINVDDIPPGGEIRPFRIVGDNGSMFNMEIYDADGNYYNFTTRVWSSTKSRLGLSVIQNGMYSNEIDFSNIASKTHVYTILLFAEDSKNVITKHTNYSERRKRDNSIDENSSVGSNSKLIKKTITQQQAVTLTLSAIAPKRGDSITDTVDGAVGSGTNIVMDTSYLTKKIIIGDKVSGTNIAAGTTISAVNVSSTADRYTLSTAVSGTVSDGAELVFAGPFNTMTPDHDTTTGSATISNLSTGAGNIKKSFSITLTAPSGRAFTILRQPKEEDLTHVSLVTFGSAALAIEGENTSSDALFYRWPVNNIAGLANNMILDPSKTKANTTIASFISDYKDTISFTTESFEEVEPTKGISSSGPSPISEKLTTTTTTKTQVFVKGVTPTASATSINRKNVPTAQAGNIIFNNQQVDALKDDSSVKIFGYGLSNINTMTFGADLKFTNLKAELTEITTTVDGAVSGSTSITIDERAGIINGTSTVKGIGIVTPPTVASGASGNTGAGTIVVSAAQTIEDNTILTFSGASNIVTITGEVEILNMPESNVTIYFDVEKFLTCF